MQNVISRDFIITTERCLLRCPSEEDIPNIFSATRFAGFNDGMLWEPPATLDELYKPLQGSLMAWDAGTAFTFTITAQQSKNFLGRISIRDCEEASVWDIGFWTHPTCQNQGYMTEAVIAILNFGFTQLAANRIQASHALWNKASQRVLEKVGMKFLEYLPEGFQKKGKWIEENRVGITKEEWLFRFATNP